MMLQKPLPPEYAQRGDSELRERIRAARARLGRRLVILGHHYQQDDVIGFADFTGDSLKLSQLAAEQKDAEYIVFCGVHFMAESADILTADNQVVILPDLSAGCSMADMAHIDQLEAAWPVLTQAVSHQPSAVSQNGDADEPTARTLDAVEVVPITYVNSSAAVKAFVGRHGGACCTSSNAKMVLEWALRGTQPGDTGGPRVLFLPDQHLGRNTAYALGWPLDSMVVFDPDLYLGGLPPERLQTARFLLWKGHCSVHALFNVAQVEAIRRLPEPYQIVVHPECSWDVCQRADHVGSTEYIIKTIAAAPAGTYWAVGTEIHLVNRLAQRCPEKHVRSVAGVQCLCSTMYRIDLKHLCWVLENLVAGRIVNRVQVAPETGRYARLALDRMLSLRPAQPVSAR